MLASGALQVAAIAGGANSVASTVPSTIAGTIAAETIRRVADMSHLSGTAPGLACCDDSCW
ncbi:hypothetical protein MTER_28420 [Mycolicibacter terrae]|uniref:Uncharacterized protein n=1 Tax=Mycolicibacter terrae TaxID=1788 RepID=A0AAD1I3Z6_9MYCO|nr:hypothetical protein MTER_28420 [Mycolicibacter terrae]